MQTRRELLRAGVAAAGAAALPLPAWAREAPAATAAGEAPLPAPPFYWGIGLDQGWIAQVGPTDAGTPALAEPETRLADLQRAADLGINCIRYGIPWHRTEPKPGKYDWSSFDAPLDHLVNKLGIIPVIDIIHYGAPAWLEQGLGDDRFLDSVTAYTAALAAHFRGLVNHYTPQNEPQLSTMLCGAAGRWPPFAKSPEAWAKLGARAARALVLQSRAIRQEAPEAVLISAESLVPENFAKAALTANPEQKPGEQLLNDVAFFPSCLAHGRVDATHPLAAFLLQNGVTENELGWFRSNFATPDIHGINCYPELEVAAYRGDFTNPLPAPAAGGGQPPAQGTPQPLTLEQAARRAAQFVEERCRLAYGYHKAPVSLMETAAGQTAEKQVAFMEALYQVVLNLRADGIPIRGVSWRPLFDAAAAPAAARYRELIRRDRGDAGLVQAPPRRATSPEAAAILAMRAATWEPSDPPNTPMGNAQGIFPGRVTWIRDARVTPWDGTTGRWWEEGNINQPVLDAMFAKSLNALAGVDANERAWDALFRHYNARHGRGNRGWQAGELIAIKINMNNSSRTNELDNNIDQSNHGLRTLLAQLTGPGRVDPACIAVYDASRVITDRLYDPLHAEFPAVRWVNRAEAPGREPPQWVENAITFTSPEVQLGNSLPKCCVDAAYLINMALLKGHEISGVTLCAKNHFGSIQYPSRDHNKYVAPHRRDIAAWSGYVDLMGSPNLGGKTMLYILDGLYATQTNVRDVTERDRWRRTFNGQWSSMLLMSQDPVAIDSVGLDFLRAEFQDNLGFSGAPAFPKGSIVNCDNYLHEAAQGRNAQLGAYCPNGQAIGSLGVHEHWNNPVDRQYSRNLDPRRGRGIELVRVAV